MDPVFSRADLERLGERVGDARLVAFGEVWHGLAEPLVARNELFRFLVEEKGFTAIALETGVAEGMVVDDWLRGGEGDLDAVIRAGFGWEFDKLPQNRALVEWMTGRPVRFYGFDTSGSPGNLKCARWYEASLGAVFAYLDQAAPGLATAQRAVLADLVRDVGLGADYDGERRLERVLARDADATTAAIADLVALVASNERRLVEAGSRRAFDNALRAAVAALQTDANIRLLPPSTLRGRPKELDDVIASLAAPIEQDTFERLMAAQNVRDRAQADNVRWLFDQEGPRGKVLLFAASAHLAGAPCRMSLGGWSGSFEVAGSYLRRWFGDDLVIIGNSSGPGVIHWDGRTVDLPEPAPGTFDHIAGGSRRPDYISDLRDLPEQERAPFDRETPLGHVPGISLHPLRSFDILVHFAQVTSARAPS